MGKEEEIDPEFLNKKIRALEEQARQLGLPVPDVGDTAPALSIKMPLKDMAAACAQNILSTGTPALFRQEDSIVTVDEGSGRTKKMTPSAFRSFVEHFMLIYEKKSSSSGNPIPCHLPCELSRDILQSEDFICKLPRLRGINLVKQPVLREGKNGEPDRYELLQPGYDKESEIFTVRVLHEDLDYDENWSLAQAFELLEHRFRFFPWGGENGVDPLGLKGVSFSVCLSAWLTLYGLSMLPKRTPTPMFLFNANEAGSGKSRLVELIIFALYGYASAFSWPKDKKESDKLINNLDSLALGGGTYLFLDNVPTGYFESPLLDQWITNTTHTTRIFNTQGLAVVEKRAMTFMTGNAVQLSPDLARRTFICDFWAEEQAQDKELPDEAERITTKFIGSLKNRGEILSALWALIKHAQANPKEYKGERRGFEEWSQRIAGVVVSCGFADPLTKRELSGTGDTEGAELKELMTLVVEEFLVATGATTAEVKLADMVPIARRAGLFRGFLFTTDDMIREMDRKKAWKPVKARDGTELRGVGELTDLDKRMQAEGYLLDNSMSTLFGKRVSMKLRGKTARDKAGNAYAFGKREGAHKATFEIKRK